MEFNTLLLHGRGTDGYLHGATLPPISQVSAFTYGSPEEQEKVFAHKSMGFAYTRIGNPGITAFEQRINELEGGAGCVATSSGMAAISNAILALVCSGDEIIVGRNLYGGTLNLFADLEKLNIKTVYADHMDPDEIRPLITEKTRLIFSELISNPSQEVMDVKAVSELAHAHGIPVAVDSTTATPYLIRPIENGADIVIHSTSKYINGGGNSIGGVVIDSGTFKWDFERFPALREYKKYGNLAFTVRLRTDLWENFGGCMAPFNAYMNTVGIETLGLRMERICNNAKELARGLSEAGETVNYLGLDTHPYHALCERDLKGYGGGILTIRAGSRERAFACLNKLKYVSIASNIGDIRTLALHPASTLYHHATEEQREAAGVYEDTIRVSVGIEDAADLVDDFIQALQ